MNTYTAFLERHLDDWRENAQKLYGCRGILTDLCQGWRHGVVLMATYPWTGGAGWLSYYLYDHYLFTQDREFLRKHVVPLLKETAEFYEDFCVCILRKTAAPFFTLRSPLRMFRS
jgi:alpha-L-fucosidase 2